MEADLKPKKVLVIGDSAVGKSCTIARLTHDTYNERYLATLGVDFALKRLHHEDGSQTTLALWDIAGQERFGQLLRVYYKNALACAIVFDVTRPVTFQNVQAWKQQLDDKVFLPDGTPIPAVLMANKCDLTDQRVISTEMIAEAAEEWGFVGFVETSAKEGFGIEDGFRGLAMCIPRVVGEDEDDLADNNDNNDNPVGQPAAPAQADVINQPPPAMGQGGFRITAKHAQAQQAVRARPKDGFRLDEGRQELKKDWWRHPYLPWNWC